MARLNLEGSKKAVDILFSREIRYRVTDRFSSREDKDDDINIEVKDEDLDTLTDYCDELRIKWELL